jgi:hypothetical protein
LWFAEHGGNAIGLLDTKIEKITEWQLVTPLERPLRGHA